MLNSFAKGIKYLFLAIFLIGVAFIVTPTKGYCYVQSFMFCEPVPNGTTLPFTQYGFLPNLANSWSPSSYDHTCTFNMVFNDVPSNLSYDEYNEFDINLDLSTINSVSGVDVSSAVLYTFSLLYQTRNGNDSFIVGSYLFDFTLSDSSVFDAQHVVLHCGCEGVPYSLGVVASCNSSTGYLPMYYRASDRLIAQLNASGGSSSSSTVQLTGYTYASSANIDGEVAMGSGTWYESYGNNAYGTFNSQAQNINGDVDIPSIQFGASFTLPGSSSASYSGTFTADDINPSGSMVVLYVGCSTSGYRNSNFTTLQDRLSNTGFSPLNFGLTGSVTFGYNLDLFIPEFLSPVSFIKQYGGNNFLSRIASYKYNDLEPDSSYYPISLIGDTRVGDYCINLGFELNDPLNVSDLTSIFNTAWGFEFNKGQQTSFGLPSSTRLTYTYYPTANGYYYLNIYFSFTAPDFFDSFLLRSGPTIPNVNRASFSFNRFNGTVSDQISADEAHWNYQNPSHNATSTAVSTATSTINTFQSIEDNSFQNLNTQFTAAGVDSFSFDYLSGAITGVSGLINSTYNILPSEVKWLLLAILVIGVFAVIISANFYVNKD